jgi:DNA processing protein
MADEEIKYWVALRLVDEIGSVGFRNLVDFFGSPRAVFAAREDQLTRVPSVSQQGAQNVKTFRDWKRVDRELEQAETYGVSIITWKDRRYPRTLLNIYDFPPFLYVRGTLDGDDVYIAVIGSRRSTTYGKFLTERLSRELAAEGVTIVSGMARGIDSAAHRGALLGGGRTVAVLGSGIDVIYPPENEDLYKRIVSQGAVITEYPFSTEPKGFHFPARNRIISGLSLGIVVVEATEKSGSLITARLGLEQGKEIFAVPGSIDSPGSRGTHKLLKDGAKLVESVHDILEEIIPQIERRREPLTGEDGGQFSYPGDKEEEPGFLQRAGRQLRPEQAAIVKLLKKTPMHIDAIIEESGCPVHDVLNILLFLELNGYVEQLPGKRFVIKE